MSDINWKEDGVCYAGGKFWLPTNKAAGFLANENGTCVEFQYLLGCPDFQLNEIRVGDFIPASELDTEQKYNEVVEVFGLFWFEFEIKKCDFVGYSYIIDNEHSNLKVNSDGYLVSGYSGNRKLTYHQIIAIGKLKRMMLEREKSAPKTTPDLTPDLAKASSNKYEREITDRQGNSATVDVYDVLKAFNVTCPATQHAVKKLLCSGLRGHKDLQTDLIEAKESIIRAIELN